MKPKVMELMCPRCGKRYPQASGLTRCPDCPPLEVEDASPPRMEEHDPGPSVWHVIGTIVGLAFFVFMASMIVAAFRVLDAASWAK